MEFDAADYMVAIEALKQQRNAAQDRNVDLETALNKANRVIQDLTSHLKEKETKDDSK